MKRNGNEKTTSANPPVYAKRVGAVRAAVWEQASENGAIFHNVSLVRRYRNDAGEWQDSSSLNGMGDVAAAMLALQLVAEWINARQDVLAQERGSDE